jgi:hypothetical protein
MRQRLGTKKLKKYAQATGLPVVEGLVRGGTNHRVDLKLEDGCWVNLWPDGTVIEFGKEENIIFRSTEP